MSLRKIFGKYSIFYSFLSHRQFRAPGLAGPQGEHRGGRGKGRGGGRSSHRSPSESTGDSEEEQVDSGRGRLTNPARPPQAVNTGVMGVARVEHLAGPLPSLHKSVSTPSMVHNDQNNDIASTPTSKSG